MNLPLDTHLSFSAAIVDEPQPTEKYLMLAASAQPPLRGTFTVFAPPTADYAYGNLLRVNGALSASNRPHGDPVMFSPQLMLVAAHKGFFLREWMIRLKVALLAKFRDALPADEAALLGGITLGARASFTPALKDAMAVSGTTHLVAISGYNITIIIMAAGALFGRFFSRRVTVALALLLIVLFMFMVGVMVSAVRAAVMGAIALAAREMGESISMRGTRSRSPLSSWRSLTRRPSPRISASSFPSRACSASSMWGPPLRGGLLRRGAASRSAHGLFDWKESAVTTFSAQIAVMPVLIAAFGRFSLTAILANILILSVTPLTMFFGLPLALLGFLSHALVFFAAKLVGLLLGYQLFVIRLFARLAVPFPIPFNSAFAIAFYYLILVLFVFSKTARSQNARESDQ